MARQLLQYPSIHQVYSKVDREKEEILWKKNMWGILSFVVSILIFLSVIVLPNIVEGSTLVNILAWLFVISFSVEIYLSIILLLKAFGSLKIEQVEGMNYLFRSIYGYFFDALVLFFQLVQSKPELLYVKSFTATLGSLLIFVIFSVVRL